MIVLPQQGAHGTHQAHRPDRAECEKDQHKLRRKVDLAPDDGSLADGSIVEDVVHHRDEDQGKGRRVFRRHQGQKLPGLGELRMLGRQGLGRHEGVRGHPDRVPHHHHQKPDLDHGPRGHRPSAERRDDLGQNHGSEHDCQQGDQGSRVWYRPVFPGDGHHEGNGKHHHDRHGRHADPLHTLDAFHAEPNVIVTGKEDQADHRPLHFEEHRELVRHHIGANGGVVIAELEGQEVAHEGQEQQRADSDEIPDESHPVVIGPLAVALGAHIHISGDQPRDESPERHVPDEAMKVQRQPGIVVHLVPERSRLNILDQRKTLHRLGRAVHERGWPIDHKEGHGADDVEQHAQGDMPRLLLALHGIPGVEIEVEDDRLRDE